MAQDKAALLAAINASVQQPKQQTKTSVIRNAQQMSERGVNSRVAHDLVSNTSRQPAVEPKALEPLTQHSLHSLPKGVERGEEEIVRSVKSEFDYDSKKKFTELVQQPSKAQQLARMQQEFQGSDKKPQSLRSQSLRSKISQKTANSRTQAVIEKINDNPAYSNKLVEELIGTLQVCNNCSCSLNEDEKIINARFIQQAASNGSDISVFPICVKCNFE
jgi:hypothetical protein